MLDSKREKLKQKSTTTERAFNMPNILANLKTSLDVFEIETDKLENAPKSWNFYKDVSNEKMFELVSSIKDIGLLHPVVVWERATGMYMILSGHSRKRAYDILFEETKDIKYQKIPCYVKKRDEISDEEAKEIIIDTNWVQRHLSSIEKAKSIFEKYTKLGKKKKSKKGESDNVYIRDIIAKQYKISSRHVSNYYRLNFLIEELKDLVEKNKISIKSGVKLSKLGKNIQTWIAENHLNNLNNKNIAKIDVKMSIEEIKKIFFDSNDDIIVSYVLKMPAECKKEDFEEALKTFLKTFDIKVFRVSNAQI